MKSDRDEFPRSVKEAAWKRCGGHCEHPACGMKIMNGARYDHVTPAALGGKGILSNCQVLCGRCHRIKTSERDMPMISKALRLERKRAGIVPRRTRFPSQRFRRHSKEMEER